MPIGDYRTFPPAPMEGLADGTEIVGAELYAGVNVLNQPGVCRFGGFFTIG